jgi:Protein of unknown function (DUF3306)
VVSEDIGNKLSRWSQRKLAARRGVPVDEGDDKPVAVAESPEPAVADADSVAGEATPALPPIDELTADSDYTVFLGKNVSTALKNAALAKLWHSNPFFNIRDGLDDYDEDFNALLSPITQGQTDYQVGKGYFDRVEETVDKLEPRNDPEKNKRVESPPDLASGAVSQTSPAAVGNSDAVVDDSDAAPQQADVDEPNRISGGQAED